MLLPPASSAAKIYRYWHLKPRRLIHIPGKSFFNLFLEQKRFYNLIKAFFQRSLFTELFSNPFKFSWYESEFIPYSEMYKQYFLSLNKKPPMHSFRCLSKNFNVISNIFFISLHLLLRPYGFATCSGNFFLFRCKQIISVIFRKQ